MMTVPAMESVDVGAPPGRRVTLASSSSRAQPVASPATATDTWMVPLLTQVSISVSSTTA